MLNKFGFELVVTTSSNHVQISNAKVLKVDLLDPRTWVHTELKSPFDFVLHAASHSPTTLHPQFIDANYKNPLDFFSRIRFSAKCKFVFCSTSGVYGLSFANNFTEYSTPNPSNIYSKSKLLFEENISEVIKSNGSTGHLLILRIPTLLGVRVSQNLIHRWIDASKKGEGIRVFNSGYSFATLILEQHIVERIKQELTLSNSKKSIENCYSNGDLTFLEAATLVAQQFHSNVQIIDAEYDVPVLSLSNLKNTWFNNLSSKLSLQIFLSKL